MSCSMVIGSIGGYPAPRIVPPPTRTAGVSTPSARTQIKLECSLFGKALSDLFRILAEIKDRMNNNPVCFGNVEDIKRVSRDEQTAISAPIKPPNKRKSLKGAQAPKLAQSNFRFRTRLYDISYIFMLCCFISKIKTFPPSGVRSPKRTFLLFQLSLPCSSLPSPARRGAGIAPPASLRFN